MKNYVDFSHSVIESIPINWNFVCQTAYLKKFLSGPT
jgi:hypothetical protein